MRTRTSNPILTRVRNERVSAWTAGETASFTGVSVKTGILLLIVVLTSGLIWLNFESMAGVIIPLFALSSIFGFIFVLLAQFTRFNALFSILYAVCEGIFLGTLSFLVQNLIEPGLIFNAVAITFIVFAFLLISYATGLFKVGNKFRSIVYTIMFCLIFFYFISFILSFFGLGLFTIASPGLALALSIGMVILASFNLLIDFDNCKIAVDQGMPKRFEWVLSLGILVSLVWLYVEVVRLLLILADRRR